MARKKKKLWCDTCDWELDRFEEEYPSSHKKNKIDVKRAKEYCEDHERIYGSKCKPIWCEECGHLKIYEIIVTDKSRKMTHKFDRRKRK